MISVDDITINAACLDFSKRLQNVAGMACGNIVEIGGGEGINTIGFLRIAREGKRSVIVVDPFEQIPGADESYFKPYSYEKFISNIRDKSEYLADHLHVIDLPSQHEDVLKELSTLKPIGLMFIDGLQDKESVMSDISLAVELDAEVICLDDYDRLTESSHVPIAVDWFRQRLVNYKFVYNGQRECYFIRA